MATDEFARRRGELQRLYAETLAGIGAGQRETFMDFGFSGDVNENNGAVSFQIDPNLQFGQAQHLLRNHALGRRQLMETNTARGLGKTGLAAQQRNLLKFMQGGDLSNLNARFMGMLGQFNRQRQTATGAYNRDIMGIDFDSARARAAAGGPDAGGASNAPGSEDSAVTAATGAMPFNLYTGGVGGATPDNPAFMHQNNRVGRGTWGLY
jgi:hypothetical protein